MLIDNIRIPRRYMVFLRCADSRIPGEQGIYIRANSAHEAMRIADTEHPGWLAYAAQLDD